MTDNRILLAIDQGTTGSTALLVSPTLEVLAKENVEFTNHFPKPGQVEHDPEEIWQSIETAVTGALHKAGRQASDIVAIGITNQRETCLFWDRETGTPIHRALVWQDRRTAQRCQNLKELGKEDMIRRKTGLLLDPYFSGTKAGWLLDHIPGARARAEAGELQFGTIDTYVAWRLTGAHVTDPSNASRTLLYNLHTGDWDDELLKLFGVPRATLPAIHPSSHVVGHTQGVSFLPDGIPVAGMIGDQQGALFGQACFKRGMAKCTYGTGAFILLNTGTRPTHSSRGMLTTVAWKIGEETTFALEGSVFIAGAAVQWLRDGLGIIQSAAEIEELARSVPDAGGVTFVPALAGLGAPHWNPDARGILDGLTRGTTRAHIARATLDGIALSIDDVLIAMKGDLGSPLTEVRVDGGAAANGFLMQRQADLLGIDCVRPQTIETTALGSALLAGLAVGIWDSTDAIAQTWVENARFQPDGDPDEMRQTRKRWAAAIQKA